MNHVSALILEVLDRAHQQAVKNGHQSAPAALGSASDSDWTRNSLRAAKRARRLSRLRLKRSR